MDKPDKEVKRSLVYQQTAVTQHPTEVSWLRCWSFSDSFSWAYGVYQVSAWTQYLGIEASSSWRSKLKAQRLLSFSKKLLLICFHDVFERTNRERIWMLRFQVLRSILLQPLGEQFPHAEEECQKGQNLAFRMSAIQRSCIVHSTLTPIFQTTSGPIRLTRTSMISFVSEISPLLFPIPSPFSHQSLRPPQRILDTACKASTH